jgi:hypothetical protein
VQPSTVPLRPDLNHEQHQMLVNGRRRLRERDAVVSAGQVHRSDPAEILVAAGDTVGLAVGVRDPGDQVRGEELTHMV